MIVRLAFLTVLFGSTYLVSQGVSALVAYDGYQPPLAASSGGVTASIEIPA